MQPDDFVGEGGLPLEDVADVLAKVIRLGLQHKYRRAFMPPTTEATLENVATAPMPRNGIGIQSVLDELETLTHTMPNFGSTSFFGFPDAGNSLAGICGAILADLLNVNMINSTFCSRTATEMEIATIRWLRELVGYPTSADIPGNAALVGGIAVSGGTMANYSGVLLAREHAYPGTVETGLSDVPETGVIVVPELIAHYTMAASMSWAGLGSRNLVTAPVKDFQYDLSALDRLLAVLKNAQRRVIMGVAYAGDSRSMTIDRLTPVSEVFRKHFPDIWLHCDGCHGTSLLFVDEHRARLKGIETYDSVTLDPHKVLNVPYPSSYLLLREPSKGSLIRTASDLIMRQARSLGQTTPVVGSKPFQSLRMWMLFKSMGYEGIGETIRHRLAAAATFAAMVDDHPNFIRLNDVGINSVMFVYSPFNRSAPFAPNQIKSISSVTQRIYDRLLEEGALYFHSFKALDSRGVLSADRQVTVVALRLMIGNPLIGKEQMQEGLAYLARLGAAELTATDVERPVAEVG